MDVVEGGDWVARITEVPNVDGGILVIVIGDDELGRDLGIPHHLRLLWRWWLRGVLAAEVVVHAC